MKPRLLDLFCGAGGAAMGYHRAGFRIVGVDVKPQPHYPFTFVQDDALAYLKLAYLNDELGTFSAIHASPPCQRYSDLARRNGNGAEHPDLIGPTRDLLELTGLPWTIENVEGAPLREPVTVCGTSLFRFHDGYRLRRHRLFETNWPASAPACRCADYRHMPVIDVSGGGPGFGPRRDSAGGRTYKGTAEQVRAIMGLPFFTKAECNEAVPPAYTQLLGAQMRAYIEEREALNV